ncbi:hypothetical protein PHYBLDRAFT_166240 [Phycomyces blakesleeanus NRRL 1555(-)]|uniref:Uncharacterized protein n=1 Tax=Phycomyces blakesleeanus (strain ATCC 8743b / DSM 1359 / FGSC 10004 / NBRC 33097 / NRRL 1555) TaxID=763407 RepID=A0A167NMB6_PHYB8|nr:hypothetical protein PHYBLDRAFT_166240 [Phycomyces blakesleeanus NRRL 1555(-)]OAD76268.1 hypothetical protein PHYBLDRAFT_166240 [Phycomyces blakesleeanus NRRL 1555(-)]|eukprot:XP_018294308.1 hypothetical protein PHYBLDRAFT_166240 [Phycomyces blakesleeanus NRRL 1555(-)]
MKEYYTNEDTPTEEDQRISGLLPFKKIKYQSLINHLQGDKGLVKNIWRKFSNDAVLILGNWSAGQSKYHGPIRGIEMSRMLAKECFQIYLIDGFKNSSLCPACQNGELETFKKTQKPRPFQRRKYPTVDWHNHLSHICMYMNTLIIYTISTQVQKQQFLKPVAESTRDTTQSSLYRLWNCDMAATLNFRHIIFNLHKNRRRPKRFCRLSARSFTTLKRKEALFSSSRTVKKANYSV